MSAPTPDFSAILAVLLEHEVEFVIVGGVAAVLHGAPLATADVDIVHLRSAVNVERLQAALVELGATVRIGPAGRRPDQSHLRSAGHQLLMTRLGPLDLLGEITGSLGYDELVADSEVVVLDGRRARVLSLERLIETKLRTGRPKDVAAVAVLRQTLAERQRGR